MTIKVHRTQIESSLLQIGSDFATLLNVESAGTFVYEFNYRVSTFEFLRDAETKNSNVKLFLHGFDTSWLFNTPKQINETFGAFQNDF